MGLICISYWILKQCVVIHFHVMCQFYETFIENVTQHVSLRSMYLCIDLIAITDNRYLFTYLTLLYFAILISLLDFNLLTYFRIYLFTYFHTCIHTYLLNYLLTYLLTYFHTCIHTYLITYLLTFIHAFILTYLPTFIHAFILTYLLT